MGETFSLEGETFIGASRTFFADETPRPLGRLTLAGESHDSTNFGPKMRVFGRFALVLVVGGRGAYQDARGTKREVAQGAAILVLPELPHLYGPRPALSQGGRWDEIYLCFDGPLFDLWRREGAMDDAVLVRPVQNWRAVFEQMRDLCERPRPQNAGENGAHLRELLAILGECFPPRENSVAEPAWLARSRAILESNLDQSLGGREAARAALMSYESFRRAWTARVGVSPSRYRDQKRLEAAQILLGQTTMTQAQIARSLGWRDEAHLSRRFRELIGTSVRQWKQRNAENGSRNAEKES